MKFPNWAREKVASFRGAQHAKAEERKAAVTADAAAKKDGEKFELAREKRQRECQERRARWWARWQAQNVRHGGPRLTGARLERTIKQCSPANLPVLPKYPNRPTGIGTGEIGRV
jgi:hypothetical protein